MKAAISYIIATKNRGSVIMETLESLIGQSNGNWEAIIVDDGGNDKTDEVVASLSDSRLHYYKLNKKHGSGASCARNYGVLLAQADIVAILDSDDLAYPGRTEVTLQSFETDRSLDVFYGNIDIWEEETNVVRDRKTPVEPFSIERLKEVSFIPHSTVAIKKKVLIDNPYNQFFRIAEDYELLTRLAVSGKKFDYTTEKLVKYRLGQQNISAGNERKKELTQKYDRLVKMIRGWLPYGEEILSQIEQLEKVSE